MTVARSQAAVQANEAAAAAVAAAASCSEHTEKILSVETSAVNAAPAAAAPSSVETASTGMLGDLGFTIYASLSGDYCVDFVPPAVDLSVNVADRLMEVDGACTRGKSYAEVLRMLRGPVGSYAAIKLFRFPQNGPPYFVETSLLRLPVLSEELRASMYPGYTSSRKASAAVAAAAQSETSVASAPAPPPSTTIAIAPPPPPAPASASALAPAPEPAPAPAPAPAVESSVSGAAISKHSSLQMESIHVWTKESLAQVGALAHKSPFFLLKHVFVFCLSLQKSATRFILTPQQLWRWTVVAAEKTQARPASRLSAQQRSAAHAHAPLDITVGSHRRNQRKAALQRIRRNPLRFLVSHCRF
jgi:hypothetical protein